MSERMFSPEVIREIREEIASSIHCALPGKVERFDSESCTADIRPMVRRRAGGRVVAMPVLKGVPVFSAGGADPVAENGDECLVIFADCAIDGWFETGEASLPVSGRMHDLADAFAFVGFRSRARMGGGGG